MALLLLPAAAAQTVQRALNNVFRLLQNTYVVYFISFVFFFILFYAIYAAAASRVRVFQGEGGVNRRGKIFSVALSALTVLGIFFLTRGRNMRQVLEDTLGWFGAFAGLLLALISFLMVWRGFREDLGNGRAMSIALFIAGLALIAAGYMFTTPSMMAWGYLIAFLTLPIGLFSLFGRGGREAGAAGAWPGAAPGVPGAGEPGTAEGGAGGRRNPLRVALHSIHPYNRAVRIHWWARPAEENVVDYELRYWPSWRARGLTTRVGLGPGHPDPDDESGQLRMAIVRGLHNVQEVGVRAVRIPTHQYYFQIRAINDQGRAGPWSRIMTTMPSAAYPDPPDIPHVAPGPVPQPQPRQVQVPMRVEMAEDGTIILAFEIQ